MGNNQIAMGNNQIAMGNNQIAMGNNQIANGICPSPSGEVRWGLKSVCEVTCSFPLGRLGWV